MLKLVIGNRNYSSWSLRAWLYLRQSGLEFEEIRIPMFTDRWEQMVSTYSPAGRVPILIDGPLRVWDSFAIIQHMIEKHGATVGWPSNPEARAEAQSVTSEMHSGFVALRAELPQNIRARKATPVLSPTCQQQLKRVLQIWQTARSKHGDSRGWLFGEFSIADVFFAPVALRIRTYRVQVDGEAQQFVEAVESLEAVQEWTRLSGAETESIDFIDQLVPADESPLTIG